MTSTEHAVSVIRLLLVEDDPQDARFLQSVLGRSESAHFEIKHVGTVAAACEHVTRDETDIIMLDLGLPDATELDGLTRLQHCVAEIPIIVLTARDDEALAVEALHRGAEDYLVKGSVDRDGLLRAIRYAVERHRGIRDLARVTRELQLANGTLERLTLLDPLTELLNRRGLQQALSDLIEKVRNGTEEVLVLLIDIDDFKKVNDTFGHAVGDVALKEVARKLKTCIRVVDFAARLGGDEFMLLMPHAGTADAIRVAERARLAVASTRIQHSDGVVHMTASIGAMMLRSDTPSVDEVLSRAHSLLARSKEEGRNRVSYDGQQFDDSDHRSDAQSEMCEALALGHNLVTVKQPIKRLRDEETVGYEFLSRYSNGIYENPDNFFRLCSERNILTIVDHQCLRHALRAAAELPRSSRFHVNLFPSTMLAIPPEHILECFPDPIPPNTFCLEISEQQIIGDPSYLVPSVRALREAGILIAIDDVGFGNSSVESLILLEPDVMKIDKRCVIGLAGDRTRIEQLTRYLKLARSFGAEIVAEGIEQPAELAILQELGVELGQGFLWGRPA
jgi:diguanylate cyclase (GGDEF)-like protein